MYRLECGSHAIGDNPAVQPMAKMAMNDERAVSRTRITLDPELLFFLPVLGYALAYAYEYGAYSMAEAPTALILVSVAQIVTACGVVLIPLLSALFASASGSTRFLEKGWLGFFQSIAFTAIGYLPIFILGLFTETATLFYLGIGSLIVYTMVTALNFWPKSPGIAGFVATFPPPVRKAFTILSFGAVACGLGLAGGAIQEDGKKFVLVVDTECGAYSRVFRTNGDVLLVLPPFRSDGYVSEIWSLSSRGTVRVKRIGMDEYASRERIAGPCQLTKRTPS